ncbi:MAG: hypothetical protein AAGI30_06855 [Planctomycetota bacterium]
MDGPNLDTWVALLAHAAEFAKRSVSIPEAEERARWHRATPSVITLQAVCLALVELPRLDRDERALGVDRAELLIAEHAVVLSEAWGTEPMPEGLLELLRDARAGVQVARSLAWIWTVSAEGFEMPHVATRIEELREDRGLQVALALPAGAEAPVGVPVLCVAPDRDEINVPGAQCSKVVAPATQWYVQSDGGALIAPLAGELPAGRPRLELLVDEGEPTRALHRALGAG